MVCCLQKCNFRKELQAPELLWTALGSLSLIRMVMLHTWNESLSKCTDLLIFPDTGNEKRSTVNITFSCLCDSNSDRPEGNKVFNRSRDMRVMWAGNLKNPGLCFSAATQASARGIQNADPLIFCHFLPLVHFIWGALKTRRQTLWHEGGELMYEYMAFPWERKNDGCPWQAIRKMHLVQY